MTSRAIWTKEEYEYNQINLLILYDIDSFLFSRLIDNAVDRQKYTTLMCSVKSKAQSKKGKIISIIYCTDSNNNKNYNKNNNSNNNNERPN